VAARLDRCGPTPGARPCGVLRACVHTCACVSECANGKCRDRPDPLLCGSLSPVSAASGCMVSTYMVWLYGTRASAASRCTGVRGTHTTGTVTAAGPGQSRACSAQVSLTDPSPGRPAAARASPARRHRRLRPLVPLRRTPRRSRRRALVTSLVLLRPRPRVTSPRLTWCGRARWSSTRTCCSSRPGPPRSSSRSARPSAASPDPPSPTTPRPAHWAISIEPPSPTTPRQPASKPVGVWRRRRLAGVRPGPQLQMPDPARPGPHHRLPLPPMWLAPDAATLPLMEAHRHAGGALAVESSGLESRE
jgi:hypothetical protein